MAELNKHVIKTFLKYAKGRYSKCKRGKCEDRIVLTDALKKMKACIDCRSKAAIHAKGYRARGCKPKKMGKREKTQVRNRL